MTEYNVKMTVEAIEEMADNLEHYAKEIRRHAASMRKDGDLTRAAEVAQAVKNCFANLRIDLLIIRPLRETMK